MGENVIEILNCVHFNHIVYTCFHISERDTCKKNTFDSDLLYFVLLVLDVAGQMVYATCISESFIPLCNAEHAMGGCCSNLLYHIQLVTSCNTAPIHTKHFSLVCKTTGDIYLLKKNMEL